MQYPCLYHFGEFYCRAEFHRKTSQKISAILPRALWSGKDRWGKSMDEAQHSGGREHWGSIVWHARASVLVFLLSAVALILPPQVQDMLSSLADFDDFALEGWLHALGFHFAMILIAAGLWYWARAVLLAWYRLPDNPDVHDRLRGALAQPPGGDADTERTIFAFDFVPRAMALGTALVALIACWRSDKPLQALIALAWGAGLYWLLKNRHALQARYGLVQTGEKTRRPERESLLGTIWQRLLELLDYAPLGRSIAVWTLLIPVALFAASAATGFWPHSIEWKTYFARLLPGPSVALFLFGMSVAPLSAITYCFDRATRHFTLFGRRFAVRHVPALLILFLLMGTATTWMNLHALRIAEGGPIAPKDRASLAVLFKRWADVCEPGTGPVQPVIVAVSGGASRAGMWAGRVLDVVDENLRRSGSKSASIFAISSVSGGSYGTAVYESMRAGLSNRRAAGATGNCFVPDAHADERTQAEIEALRADAIGPALAGALLGDMPRALAAYIAKPALWVYHLIHKLGPGEDRIALLRGNDRAEALEGAFERNWRLNGIDTIKAFAETPVGLEEPYLSLFYTAKNRPRGDVPLWITNGTNVQTGDRLITVPFDLNKETFCTAKRDKAPDKASSAGGTWYGADAKPDPKAWRLLCAPNQAFFWYEMGPFYSAYDALGLLKADVPISTALDNTSRFPFLSPSGELTPPVDPGAAKEHDAQIIDGGYFENEGVESAMEIARWLRTYGKALIGRPVYPIIVQATADADPGKKEREIPRCANRLPPNPDVADASSRASQFLVPMIGLASVRGGHSRAFLREALDNFCDEGGQQAFFHFYLYDAPDFDVPLNWSLSEKVADYIWNGAMAACGNAAETRNLLATLKLDPNLWKLQSERPRRAARTLYTCTDAPVPVAIPDLPMLKDPTQVE
jgi:hypothetical protein